MDNDDLTNRTLNILQQKKNEPLQSNGTSNDKNEHHNKISKMRRPNGATQKQKTFSAIKSSSISEIV